MPAAISTKFPSTAPSTIGCMPIKRRPRIQGTANFLKSCPIYPEANILSSLLNIKSLNFSSQTCGHKTGPVVGRSVRDSSAKKEKIVLTGIIFMLTYRFSNMIFSITL